MGLGSCPVGLFCPGTKRKLPASAGSPRLRNPRGYVLRVVLSLSFFFCWGGCSPTAGSYEVSAQIRCVVWSRFQGGFWRVPVGSGVVGDITWAYFYGLVLKGNGKHNQVLGVHVSKFGIWICGFPLDQGDKGHSQKHEPCQGNPQCPELCIVCVRRTWGTSLHISTSAKI